jgi:hypothetical protein
MTARDTPVWAKTFEDLDSLSDKELKEQHDKLAVGEAPSPVTVDYYLAELARRKVQRQTQTMLWLTVAIGLLTLVNVIAVVIDVASK